MSDYTTANNTSLTLEKFNTEPVMTIHPDGRVTVTDKFKPNEAAAKVVEAFKTRWMADVQATKIREQQDRIKRLEEALESIREYWNRDNNQRAMVDACWYAIDKSSEALEAKEDK